uniref:biotin/lipoyl-containing protein n=1 Tax=Alistipes sp. TaxID=1872444 RepID=UPI004055FE56
MAKTLKIRDLTLRDGQQSSFATRMTQAQVERCLPYYKDAHFYAMEVWGGAVPDSVMRYLNENPWTRLESIKKEVGNVSKLTALSRGRNLFGYAPYTDEIIEGFCRNSIESGLGIMRIFDCLNDVNNVKSTIKYVKKYGGIADCAVCYTVDPKYPKLSFWQKLMGKKNPAPVFTDEYFVSKAKVLAGLGADMITIKDMSGLIPPHRVSALVKKLKAATGIPVDFHTHCTPGYGLASVYAAIAAGVDVVDTNCWWFGGGTGAPALELVYLFCQKLGIDMGVNMEAVAKINEQLKDIRTELNVSVFGKDKPAPKPFNPLTDATPAEVEEQLNRAVKAAEKEDFTTLLDAAQKIEAYFGFPAPNKLVQEAEIPGGMYSNMVAQLQALKAEDILPKAMELIPEVRLSAGLPPLVTPTSQIVGAQAVNCALDLKAGRPMYTTKNNQFVNLVKGEYGETPVKIDPEFRFKICGVREESNYDISKYQHQPNPELPEAGGVKLAENEKEELLLELFPLVAKPYLTGVKTKAYQAKVAAEAPAKAEAATPAEPKAQPITGHTIAAPLPGKVIEFKVKVGDAVAAGQEVAVLEAMKMENSITSDAAGYVKQILVATGENVATDTILIELSDAPLAAPKAEAAAPKAVSGNKVVAPLPGRVISLKVKEGDTVAAGQEVVVLEAMKMENSINSDYAGTVQQVLVAEGDNVATDAVLLIVG